MGVSADYIIGTGLEPWNTGGGMLVSIFNVGGISEDEMALATPDLAEGKSLSRHVERCAMRFRLLANGQAALGRTQIIILAMGAYLVLVSEPARNMLAAVRSLL